MSHFDHVQASYADAGQREIRRLRDEVEALRVQVQLQRDALTEQLVEAAKLRAQVQAVREACNTVIENAQRFDLDDEHGLVYGQWMTAKSILRALDGNA